LHAARHRRFRYHAGSIDIDALEFGIRNATNMRSMKGRRMNYRIRSLKSSPQQRLVREIVDDMGGGKGGAVYASDIMPAGEGTENRAADPTGAARQHYPHDVPSASTEKQRLAPPFKGSSG
jgi:hypothetical protein